MAEVNNTDKYNRALKAITEQQSKIVGEDIAINLASSVKGVGFEDGIPIITGESKEVLRLLVEKYSMLFGQVSVQVSKDAVYEAVPDIVKSELPSNLQ
jgi:hypothetical protein